MNIRIFIFFKPSCLSVFLLLVTTAFSQNLVPNPGFEGFSSYDFTGVRTDPFTGLTLSPIDNCERLGHFYSTKGCKYEHKLLDWYTRGLLFQPINLKGKYVTETGDSLPTIFNVYEDFNRPRSGDGTYLSHYAQHFIRSELSGGSFLYTEQFYYFSNSLTTPLEAGKKYYVEFYVRYVTQDPIDPSDKYFPSDIGLLFSDDLRPYTSFERAKIQDTLWDIPSDIGARKIKQIEREASVSSLPGRFYLEDEWQRVCGFYTATGGEKYLSIGNFNQDELWYYNEEFGVVDLRNLENGSQAAYRINGVLFIDDVRVEEYEPGMFFKGVEDQQLKVCQDNLPYQLELKDLYESYEWQDGNNSSELTITEEGVYSVDLDAYGCLIKDSIEVVFEESIELDVKDTTLCPAEFPYVISVPEYSNLLWSNLDSTNTTQLSNGGLYWIGAENSCGLSLDTFLITEIDTSKFNITLPEEISFCSSHNLDTTLTIPSYFSEIRWKDGDTTREKQFLDTTTNYFVELSNRCLDTIYDFEVLHYPEEIILSDTFHCNNDTLEFPVSIGYDSFLWNTGDTTISFIPEESKEYYLEVKNTCGKWTDTVDIIHIPFYDRVILDTSLKCNMGVVEPIELSISLDAWDYVEWFDGSTSSKIEIDEETAVHVSVSNKCQTREDTAFVLSCPPDLEFDILAPNVISPNGDGLNDCFEIVYYNISSTTLRIINRQGKVLSTTSSVWCPSETLVKGTYFYEFTFVVPSGKQELQKGWVIVL